MADGDRFSVEISAIVRNSLECVAKGVTEVQDGSQAALRLVLPHYLRLDLAAASDDDRQATRFAMQEPGQILLQPPEEPGVVNDAVLDHLGQPRPVLTPGQRGQRVQVTQDESRLVERPDQILTRFEIQTDFAADGAVHLGEKCRRHLDERNAAQIGSRHEARQITHDSPAQRDDERLAFQVLVGQSVVAGRGRL